MFLKINPFQTEWRFVIVRYLRARYKSVNMNTAMIPPDISPFGEGMILKEIIEDLNKY